MTIFQTNQLDQAAFIAAKGARYIGSRNDGLGGVFEFEDPDLCSKFVGQFMDDCEVPAKTLLIWRKRLLTDIKQVGSSLPVKRTTD